MMYFSFVQIKGSKEDKVYEHVVERTRGKKIGEDTM